MSKMMDRMTSTSGSIDVNTSRLFDSGSGFWRWSGSLTTPPCSEDVLWSLSKTVQKITAAHTEAFKTHLGRERANAWSYCIEPEFRTHTKKYTLLGFVCLYFACSFWYGVLNQ
jgi:hypothetical protein